MLREQTIGLIDATSRLTPSFCIIAGVLTTVLFGILDYLTGQYIPFYLAYLIPVLFVTASIGRFGGLLLAILAASVWFVADHLPVAQAGEVYRPFLNGSVGMLAFIIPSSLLSILVDALRHEKEQARIDPLTRVANLRCFHIYAREELERTRRYNRPFSFAYIDLDHFKSVNDINGHAAGDAVLRQVAEAIRNSIRINDTAGRLGGDEFALLMPETGIDSAKSTIQRVREQISATCSTLKYPITCSIGLITCVTPPESVDTMIAMADDLMYSVKRRGKDGVEHQIYDGTLWDEGEGRKHMANGN